MNARGQNGRKLGFIENMVLQLWPSLLFYCVVLCLCQYYNIGQEFGFRIMAKVSRGCQTEQFLGLLTYEDKLTKLYQRIKMAKIVQHQYQQTIQHLQQKNQALERSLYQYEVSSHQKQSYRNQLLLNDLIDLEEQLHKERSEVTAIYHQSIDAKPNNSLDAKSRVLEDQVSLVTIKEEPELQNPPTSKRPSQKPNPSSTSCPKPQNNSIQAQNNLSQARKQSNNSTTRRPLQPIDQNTSSGCPSTPTISDLQHQMQKQQKNKRVMQCQMRRLRKLNQEYSVKCRKLEKLLQAKSELYSTISLQLTENYGNAYGNLDHSNCSGIPMLDHSYDGGALFQ